MTKKKNHNEEEYDWDELDAEEHAHRKGGLRRHRNNRPASNPFDLPEEPWPPLGKKGRNRDD